MKKQNRKKTSNVEVKGNFTAREMADFIYSTFPQLAEAYTSAELELALDDRGWLTSGRQSTSSDIDAQSRALLVHKSRMYWAHDPLMKQAVRLWTDYSLGDGFTYSSTDAGTQKDLDLFMKDIRNRRLTASEGQRRSSKKCLVDGELFFAIFDEGDGKVIRRVDPLQITDVICDPDDDDHIIGYRRKTKQDKVLFYRDWTAQDSDLDLFTTQTDPNLKVNPRKLEDCLMIHVPFDALHKRGNGLLFSAVDWSKEHRRFMEARVAITQALAKFAWGAKVEGGQAIVNAVQSKLQSTHVTTGPMMVERHPNPAPGSTLVTNKGMDMTPMPRATGAGDAASDGNQIKLMVCAATGIMLHYFGDPSTGNLATATAMELPMLKQFGSYQTFTSDYWRDIFSVVLEEEPGEVQENVVINMPSILEDDLQALGTFIAAVTAVFPEAKVESVLRECLSSMNVTNLDDVMKEIKKNKIDLDQKAADLAKQIGTTPVKPGADPAASNKSAAAEPNESERMKLLAEAIEKLAGKL